MLIKQNKQGIYLTFTALIISFTSTNMLIFYFEQFSTIIMVAFQILLLIGLIEYNRRLNLKIYNFYYSG
jgi:hypothetical protein